jgi:quinol-cytochrome oxidoreductase complex cytochrome b subunit
LISGALEMFYYVATPEAAPLTIQALTFHIPFGGLLRRLHFWSAQALVIAALIHLLRVIWTGAYAPPRRFNYLLGLSQFLIILMLDFSGYVLRWDEGVHWAIVVGTRLFRSIPFVGNQLYQFVVGGNQIGPATLNRFYAWHIFSLTFLLILGVAWHIFRVRRDGGIAVPPIGVREDASRIWRQELVYREFLAALLALSLLLVWSELVPAPLAAAIVSPASPSVDASAPWFFLWVQGLLRLGDPFWMGVALPTGVVLLLALIPFILPIPPDKERGRWFPAGGRLAQVVAGLLGLSLLLLTIYNWMVQ